MVTIGLECADARFDATALAGVKLYGVDGFGVAQITPAVSAVGSSGAAGASLDITFNVQFQTGHWVTLVLPENWQGLVPPNGDTVRSSQCNEPQGSGLCCAGFIP